MNSDTSPCEIKHYYEFKETMFILVLITAYLTIKQNYKDIG